MTVHRRISQFATFPCLAVAFLLMAPSGALADTAVFYGASDEVSLQDWLTPPASTGEFLSDEDGLVFVGGDGASGSTLASMTPAGIECGAEVGAYVEWEVDLERTDTVPVLIGGIMPDPPTVRFAFGPMYAFVVLRRVAEDSDAVWVAHRYGSDVNVSGRMTIRAERTDPDRLIWSLDADGDGLFESPLGQSMLTADRTLGRPAISVSSPGYHLALHHYTVSCEAVSRVNEPPAPVIPAYDIEVDPSEVHQLIDGFGGSVAYRPGLLYGLDEPQRSEVLDLLFDDLGATLIRMRVWDEIEPTNDNDDPGDLDLSAFDFGVNTAGSGPDPGDTAQVWTVQQALMRGIDTVMSTSWSPPGWMKTTGEARGGPERNTGQLLTPDTTPPSDQSDPEYYYREFAEWVTAYALAYEEQHGIHIDYLSPQNEANIPVTYHGMEVNPEEFHLLTRLIYERFQAEGVTTEIMMPENNGPRNIPSPHDTISHMMPTLEDPVTRAQVGVIGTHQASSAGEMRYLSSIAEGYGLHVWLTEHHLANVGGGGMDAALELARDLHEGVVLGNVNAYFTWCYSWLPDAAKTQGLITIPMGSRTEYTITKPYYAFRHWSREVRPGSSRVSAHSHDPRLRVGAFINAGRVIVTVINDRAEDIPATMGLETAPGTVQVWRTSETEDYASVDGAETVEGGLSFAFAARSITTLVAELPGSPPPPPPDGGSVDADAGSPDPGGGDAGGCSCRVYPPRQAEGSSWFLALVAVVFVRRRGRGRRRATRRP